MPLLTDAQNALARMLSRCNALQTWQGNNWTEAQVLARIYHDTLPDPFNGATHSKIELENLRPFIIIGADTDEILTLRRAAMGSDAWWNPAGVLQAIIEQSSVGTDEANVDLLFKQTVENMLATGNPSQPGLLELSNQPDVLQITSIAVAGPYRVPVEDINAKGDCQRFYLRINWGTE